MSVLPGNLWKRYANVVMPTEPWMIGTSGHGSVQEVSVVGSGSTWRAWYTGWAKNSGGSFNPSFGIGYATGPTSLGPFTPYSAALAAATLTDPSFETDGNADGLADGWTLSKNAGGAVTCSLVAGRTGGNAQRVQYTAQAGDTGKYIMIYQVVAAGLALNETVQPSVWAKGSVSGGCTVAFDTANPIAPVYPYTPTGSWQQVVSPGQYAEDFPSGSVTMRVCRVYFASDSGSVDITLDDAALSHGITNPVRPRRARSSVIQYGDLFYMFSKEYTTGTIVMCSSSDGITWGAETTILSPGSWDGQLESSWPFQDDDGTWYLYYESTGGAWGPGGTGVAVSSASIGGPYTKYIGNPIQTPGSNWDRPQVFKLNGQYLMYCHGGAENGAVLGDVPKRAIGTSPYSFVIDQDPVFARLGADEGAGLAAGQAADVRVINDGERYVMYYTANDSYTDLGTYPSHTKAATAGGLFGISRTVPLTSGDGQNFAMTAGEHVLVQFTTDTPLDEVASAEWVAVASPDATPAVDKTTAIVLTATPDGSGTVATVELLGTDSEALEGTFTHQLWIYDSAGDGVVAARGVATVESSLVVTP